MFDIFKLNEYIQTNNILDNKPISDYLLSHKKNINLITDIKHYVTKNPIFLGSEKICFITDDYKYIYKIIPILKNNNINDNILNQNNFLHYILNTFNHEFTLLEYINLRYEIRWLHFLTQNKINYSMEIIDYFAEDNIYYLVLKQEYVPKTHVQTYMVQNFLKQLNFINVKDYFTYFIKNKELTKSEFTTYYKILNFCKREKTDGYINIDDNNTIISDLNCETNITLKDNKIYLYDCNINFFDDICNFLC